MTDQAAAARQFNRILLAEDSTTLSNLISRMLTHHGREVLTAENGRRAVEIVEAAGAEGQPIDLILMDVNMPEMTGYDATWTLRRNGYTGRIIILTAIEEEYDMARSLCNGADDFLAKPFSPEQLAQVIKAHAAQPSSSIHAGAE
jgi:DNA-binding response OmpR family regulator